MNNKKIVIELGREHGKTIYGNGDPLSNHYFRFYELVPAYFSQIPQTDLLAVREIRENGNKQEFISKVIGVFFRVDYTKTNDKLIINQNEESTSSSYMEKSTAILREIFGKDEKVEQWTSK